MIRRTPAPGAAAAASLRREFAALVSLKAEVERLLDLDDEAAARQAARSFFCQAKTVRRALDAILAEVPPPAAVPCAEVALDEVALDEDDQALRMNLPDRLHAVMSLLTPCRRQAMAALGERRRLALRSLGAACVLAAVLALAAGGREVWRWRQQTLQAERQATFSVDLLNDAAPLPPDFKVGGLLSLERDAHAAWRWGIGPRTVVAFVLPLPRTVRLSFRLNNPLPGQVVTVTANGRTASLSLPAAHEWMKASEGLDMVFPGKAGLNAITISYKAYNQFTMAFAPDNPTGFAVAFTAFTISTEKP